MVDFKFVILLNRWDVLMEILDAQKERISRFEIPNKTNAASSMIDTDSDVLGMILKIKVSNINKQGMISLL